MKKMVFFLSIMVFVLSAMQSSTKIIVNMGPCKNDIEQFCSAETRLGAVIRCLKYHGNEIADNCSNHLKKLDERVRNILMACKDDIRFACQGAKKNEVLDCLDNNKSEVSDNCRQHLEEQ